MINYSYRKNEWVAMYVDENGDRQVLAFDTFEQAVEFLRYVTCKIGVFTTSFYNAYLAKEEDEEVPTF